ncbi:aldehyde dehydrogenase family protein [Ideonella sp. A 288]|uniref:aldehyde dehydrogenase family protein n=1 Tax=Ideonella sp. A 288 TaxID=1962181 RepID=UPI003855E6CE
MLQRPHQFINGQWVASANASRHAIINPYTEAPLGWAALGDATDVDAAVAAARAAWPAWASMPRLQRAQWLGKLAGALKARIDTIGALESAEMGSPISFSLLAQAQLPVMVMGSYAEMVAGPEEVERIGNSRVVREPVGVVAAITAWNYPLLLLFGKVAPAMAAGCTVVAKPSEIAPLTSYLLADAMAEIGFPAGVFNLVNGTGIEVGEALVRHPDVDMVSYTGSTVTGRRIMANAAPTVKKLALELGGKSASVLLADAPLEQAVRGAVQGAFINGGQTCIALSRLIVPQELHGKALDIAADEAARFKLGDPMDKATTMGPMAFAGHRDRVRKFIREALTGDSQLVCGGAEQPKDLPQGYFVSPTIFGNVDPQSTLAQQEVFGPVLAVIPSRDENHAVEIANGTIYGLNGAVWSADLAHAVAIGRRLRCGKVDINGGGFNMNAPAGGFKQSGIGRERGRYGLEEYLEVKALQFNNEELATRAA